MKREKAVIDGANAAYLEAPRQPRADMKNIFAVVRAVQAAGHDPIVVIDPTNRSIITDAAKFQAALAGIEVLTVPPGEEIDRMVLQTAEHYNARIVSNNTYAQYYEEYPWVEERRIPIALVNGSIHLLEHRFSRAS
jgi:hypothetical protein